LSWVGLCSASGRLVDIPILTRYLAGRLQGEDGNNPPKSLQFLLILDAGNHPSHLTGTVQHYVADWWSQNARPRPSDFINNKILRKCLEAHQQYLTSYLRSDKSPDVDGWRQKLMPGPLQLPCHRCALYRKTAIDILHSSHHHLRNYMQKEAASVEQLGILTARRASAHMRLNEEALQKETLHPLAGQVAGKSSSTATPALHPPAAARSAPTLRTRKVAAREQPIIPETPSITQLIEIMRQHFEAERDRLVQHPSLKWTWGVDVEEADLRHMIHRSDRNRPPHTGYEESLPENFAGEWSNTVPHPHTTDRQYHTDAGNPGVPELSSNDVPLHFHKHPLRRDLGSSPPSGRLPLDSTSHGGASTRRISESLGAVSASSELPTVSPSAVFEALMSPDLGNAFRGLDAMNLDSSPEGGMPVMITALQDTQGYPAVSPLQVFEELANLALQDENDPSSEVGFQALPVSTLGSNLLSPAPEVFDSLSAADTLHALNDILVSEQESMFLQPDAVDTSAVHLEIAVPSPPTDDSDICPTDTLNALHDILVSEQESIVQHFDAGRLPAAEFKLAVAVEPKDASDIDHVSPTDTLHALQDVLFNTPEPSFRHLDADEDSAAELQIQLPATPDEEPDLEYVSPTDTLNALHDVLFIGQESFFRHSNADEEPAAEAEVLSAPEDAPDVEYVSPSATWNALQDMFVIGEEPVFRHLDVHDDLPAGLSHPLPSGPDDDSDAEYVSLTDSFQALRDVINQDASSSRQSEGSAAHEVRGGSKWTAADFQDVHAPEDYDT
jgi:hypothetical protein